MITMMKTAARTFLAIVALSLGLAACNDGLPPAAQYSSFTGTVVDAVTHAPIAGATVVVDTVLTTTTDANGSFTVPKVPSGIVDYVVSANGYADVSLTGNAEPGKPLAVSVTMQTPASPHP
jgi:Carboxypeptidase regulatory-like domain